MRNSDAMVGHVVIFLACIVTVAVIVAGEFGLKWGFAAAASLWVLAPQAKF